MFRSSFQTGLMQRALTAVLLCSTLASAFGQEPARPEPIRHIFVPHDQLRTPLGQDQSGVLVSAAEFARLYRAAQAAAPETGLGQILPLRADYAASIDGDQLLATLTVPIQNSSTSEGTFAFTIGGWRIQAARWQLEEGAALPVATPFLTRVGERGETLQVLVPRAPLSTLVLELSLPLTAIGSDKSAQVELSGIPAGAFQFTLPAGRHLLLDGLELPRPTPITEAATYTLPSGGVGQLNLQVTDRKQTERADLLTFVNTAYGVTVAPGEVTWVAQSSLQVFGKPLDRLTCTVPRSLEITSVDSEGLESWELADAEGDRTAIELRYRLPFDGQRLITFRGVVSADPAEPWSAPNLKFSNVTSHVGTLVVSHPSGVRLQALEARGVRAVTELAIPEGLVAPGTQLKYQLWEEEFALRFTTSAKQQEVRGAMTNILDVNHNWFDLYTSVNLETRFAPLFEARVVVPENWMVVQVLEGGAAVTNWTLLPVENGQEVRLALSQPLNPGETREISLISMQQPVVWPVEAEPQTIPIPEVKLPQAGMVEALYGIVADDAFAVVPQNIVGLDPARQEDVNTLNQRLAGIGKQVRLGFAYQDTIFSGELVISRKPATLVADTVTFARLDPNTIFVDFEATLEVTGGGVRELQLLMAEAAGADLRFELLPVQAVVPMGGQGGGQQGGIPYIAIARIVEQSASDPVNGMRTWTLKLDRYLVGSVLLTAIAQVPRGADAAAAVAVPHWELIGTEQQSGFVAVEAANDQRVQVTALGADEAPLRTVDPVDFPAARYQPQQRVIAGYQFTRPGWSVNVTAERFDRIPVPTALGQSLALQSIVSETGEIQHEALLQFSAVGIQSLLVKLQEESRLWASLLDNQPVEVRGTPEGYQIPLPLGNDAAQHVLKLIYATHTPPLTEQGELRALPPTFAALAGGGGTQPLEVLQQTWNVSTPEGTRLVSSHGVFEPSYPLEQDTLFGRLLELLALPSPARLYNVALATLITIVVLLSIRALATRLGWKWTTGLLAVAGLCLVGLVVTPLMILSQGLGTAPPETTATPAYDYPMAESAPTQMYLGDAVQDAEMPANQLDEFSIQRGGEMDMGGQGGGGGFAGGFGGALPPGANTPADGLAVIGRAPAPGSPVPARNLATPAAPALVAEPESRDRQLFDAPPQVAAPQAETEIGMPAQRVEDLFQRSHDFIPQVEEAAKLNEGYDLPYRQGSLATGALLSMTVALEAPVNYVTRQFVYRGNGTDGVDLRVVYADQESSQLLLWCVITGALLISWWLRKSSRFTKALWALLMIALPWGLAPLLPSAWQGLAQALLLGGLFGVALWLVYTLVTSLPQWCRCCCERCCSWLVPAWARRTTTSVLLLFAVCGAGSAALADEAPPAPKAPYVIIPYAEGTDPLQAEHIFVPHDLYQRLWNAAHPEDVTQPDRPGAHIVEALYAAKLVTDGATPRIDIQARLLAVVNGPTPAENPAVPLPAGSIAQVRLPFANVSINSLLLNGEAVTVQPAGAEALYVPVTKTGTHVLDVHFDLPVKQTGAAGEFKLSLVPVPAGRMEFTLPQADAVAQVNHSTATYRRITEGETTKLAFPIDQGGLFEINWSPKQTDAMVTGTLQAETAVAVLVEDAGLSVNQTFVLTPRQQALNEVSFEVTAGASVRRIAGEDVGGWELNEAEGATTLKVFLRRPVEAATRLDIDLFQPLTLNETPSNVVVPLATPQGVASERGLLGVYSGDQFSLRGQPGEWVSQINSSAFTPAQPPAGANGAPQLAYRFVMRPAVLTLAIGRRPPEAITLAEHGVTVQPRKLLVASRLVFQLTGAPRPSVSIALPEAYLAIDVAAEGMSDWYLTQQGEVNILTVEFDAPKLGEVVVMLEGRITRDMEFPNEFIAGVPSPKDVSRLTSTLAIWLPEGETASIGDAGNWKSVDPNTLSASIRELDPATPQFAFRTSDLEPMTVIMDVVRSQPELQGDAVTVIAVTDTTVDYGLTLRWKIVRSATDTFQFTTPSWLEGRLDIQAPGVREVQPLDLGNGNTLWTVTLIEPVREAYLLTAAATIPAPATGPVPAGAMASAPSNTLPVGIAVPAVQFQQTVADKPQAIEFQRHYALLANLSSAQVTAVDPNLIETVPREELPLQVSEELVRQAMEVVRVRPQREPRWQWERKAAQQGPNATVLGADLVTAIEEDGSWRTRATYIVRNRGRQFLGLFVPEHARLMSVFVRGEASRAVATTINGKSAHLIALPQTSITDLSFEIRVILAGQLAQPLPKGIAVRGTELHLPVPQIVSPQDSPEHGLSVAQTLWNVYLPEGHLVRPIRDVSKTNLTWHLDRDMSVAAQLTRLESLRNDAAEMFRLANDATLSQSMVFSCASNLKNIEEQLQQAQQDAYTTSRGRSAAEEQVLQEQTRLLGEVQKNLSDLSTRVLQSGEGEFAGGQAGGKDVKAGRKFIEFNNRFNYDNNGTVDMSGLADSKEGFTFAKGMALSEPMSKARESEVSRGKLKGRFMEQQAIMGNSLNSEYSAPAQVGAPISSFSSSGMMFGRADVTGNFSFQNGQMTQYWEGISLDVSQTQSIQRPADWSSAGGLSLAVDIPTEGQVFSFSKVGGEPRLAFEVHPRESSKAVRGGLWSVLWLALGAWACHWLARISTAGAVLRVLGVVLALGGLATFLLLPFPFAAQGCIAAILGGILLCLFVPLPKSSS